MLVKEADSSRSGLEETNCNNVEIAELLRGGRGLPALQEHEQPPLIHS